MKHQPIYLALSVLLFASLACQTLSGGGGGNEPVVATNAGDFESASSIHHGSRSRWQRGYIRLWIPDDCRRI